MVWDNDEKQITLARMKFNITYLEERNYEWIIFKKKLKKKNLT